MVYKKRIVVLEDDRTTSSLIAWPLVKLGYSVSEASEGRMAIEMAVKENSHLLIADMMLPDMKGMEALQEIIRQTKNAYFKALFVTSLLCKNGKPMETRLEIDGLHYPAIGKPVRPDMVCQFVQSLIGGPN